MAEGFDSLGKARLDVEANLIEFEKNIAGGRKTAEGMGSTLEHLAAIADLAEHALNRVKMSPGQGAESRVSAESIISGVRGISEEATVAAREIDRVRLKERQAAESEPAAGLIERMLDKITRKANEARRAVESVRIVGGVPGRSGVGVGPFGSGFGRVGALGTAIGAGVLAAPAAGPGAAGLLAAIPGLAFTGAGALGTLVLAFKDVGKAIGGDKKAFDELGPSAQKFVLTVRSLGGFMDRLRATAADSLFPGLSAGLHAALSPGTVSAITKAVQQFGGAIGQAGLMWGRYFGSAQFQQLLGPLMTAGARSVVVLSDAMLHLFDALSVLARAAIPFTDWINRGIDQAARFASSWMRAKEASGALGRGLDEAKSSLRLVAALFAALVKVTFALGQALYPVAKVFVKALTDGLNGLTGVIHRNQQTIRDIVGGALKVFIFAVKNAAGGVGVLWHGLQRLIGNKAAVIAAIAAIGIAIAVSLGPTSAVIVGALIAIGLIKSHWRSIVGFFKTLGREIVNAFKYLWVQLERGALTAALKVVEPFSHLPGFLGGWARKAKDAMQHELARLHPPNMNWSNAAAQAGVETGSTWAAAFNATARKATIFQVGTTAPAGFKPGTYGTRMSTLDNPGGFQRLPKKKKPPPEHEPTPGTHAWYVKYLGYDPTTGSDSGSVFGTPRPFTKNVPAAKKPPVIPASVSHLLSLASQQASQAGVLKNVGAAAKRHLETELADLQKADRELEAKYKTATGAARTQLFTAITSVENKMRTVRERIRKSIRDDRAERLRLAVDQAKAAVEGATEGSAAYAKAVKAEERALRAEIAYWDKRAHNLKLSADARDKALRKEISDRKQLKALLKPEVQNATADLAQFTQSFKEITQAFAPNAWPAAPGGGKTDTHLYDLVHESRLTNKHLKLLVTDGRFPASAYESAAAAAVSG